MQKIIVTYQNHQRRGAFPYILEGVGETIVDEKQDNFLADFPNLLKLSFKFRFGEVDNTFN